MSLDRYRRFWRRRLGQEVDAELRFHFDMRVEELTARGMSPELARREVLDRLGNADAARLECQVIDRRRHRRETLTTMFETLIHDLRLVFRSLNRQKAWTTVAVVTLALGIGANSALFAIINAVLIRPLPYPDPDRIVSISEAHDGKDGVVVVDYVFAAWRDAARSLSSVAAYSGASTVMRGVTEPENVPGRRVTQAYFSILGVAPMLGRTFTTEEDSPGGPPVILLSERIWRRMYNADRSIIGRTILLNETPATVVGVMPASLTTPTAAQYWQPYQLDPPNPANGTFYFSVIGRLRAGATLQSTGAELQAIERRANATRGPEARGATTLVMTAHDRIYGDARPALLILFAAVGVLLFIACANVSNLLLARVASRQREFAIRVAIGASMWRLVRYLLCESLVLSAAGAVLGLLMAFASVGYFVHISPQAIAGTEGIRINAAVVVFTTAVAVLTGVLFGLLPAWQVHRVDVNTVLANSAGRHTGGTRHTRVRRALVVGELATALVLLTAAGLLTKSFARVTSIDPGIQGQRMLTGAISLSVSRYKGDAPAVFFETLQRRIAAIPGVEGVTLSDALPLQGVRMSMTTTIDGKKTPMFYRSSVGQTFFKVLGIPVIAGRPFNADDRRGAEPVAIVNQTMVNEVFGGRDVVGRRYPLNSSAANPALIIGVVKDVLQRGVEEGAMPIVYLPLEQDGVSNYLDLIVRTAGRPEPLIPVIRRIVREIDPAQPAPSLQTVEQLMSNAVAPRRFSFVLLGIFATVGGILSAIGLYGVMAYLVTERTSEIGIRMALGADRARVVWFVTKEGMTMALAGLVSGFVGSIAGVRALRSMLYQVDVYDPTVFVAGAILLVVIAAAACALPAWRAARIDPATALRAS